MTTKLANIIVMVLVTLLIMSSFPLAAQLFLEPDNTYLITSPEDNRDQRLLLYFDLPKELYEPGVEIEQAVLTLKGRVQDADLGQIDVFPVTSEWYQAGNVSWNSPWEKPGGDYTTTYMGRSVTLKHSQGMRLIRLNVIFMVKAWLDDVMENNGLILMISQDDIENTSIKFTVDEMSPMLKIRYEHN
jgi:hypothetical protein